MAFVVLAQSVSIVKRTVASALLEPSVSYRTSSNQLLHGQGTYLVGINNDRDRWFEGKLYTIGKNESDVSSPGMPVKVEENLIRLWRRWWWFLMLFIAVTLIEQSIAR